ncbi:NFACT family protein [Prochlorococcus sp. MIT 1307]|uniref:Rqc2 family fibronectin-binding protein n=1 Tax=Prochlorococcus sp. MIT 1307 TaxID=3096219 RepID=UPI002A758CAA|nr:NFACT RNA binding domain-containing protein [Prochlorococcus sp. MIT 1307]
MNSAALQIMDITSLKAVLAELRQIILPSRFEKAQQPEPGTIQIGLRTLKGLIWLEISWQADAPRLVQISPPSRSGSESTLAQQVQHGLNQIALVEIKQKGFERVVEFRFAKRPGSPVYRSLIIELMGRHSNLLLLDNEDKIITLGRQVRDHQSRVRPLGTGDNYVPPPRLQGIEPSSKETFHRWKARLSLIPMSLKQALQETYQGISPSLALQLAGEESKTAQRFLSLSVLKLSEDQWHYIYNRWRDWLTKLENESLYLYFDGPTPFRFWSVKSNNSRTSEDMSLSLGKYYRRLIHSKMLNQLIKELEYKLKRIKANEEKHLSEQETLLSRTSESKSLQDKANLILSQPSPNSELIVRAQKLYNKAKKIKRSSPIIKERICYHKNRLKSIEESYSFLEEISTSKWESDTEKFERLIELSVELEDYQASSTTKNQSRKRKLQRKKTPPSPLSLKAPSGLEVLIGRNHRQNEWISLQKARSGDIWFHVQECPGSHVILKASNGLAEEADIQMAADLAAFFSRAKGNRRVPVLMVATDHLQRVPGATPGTVRHRDGTVCWGEPLRGLKHINV